MNGAATWAGPYTIGTGWLNFNVVVSGGNGVLYAVASDGTLRWYRDLDPMGSTRSWATNSGATIGSGWSNFGTDLYAAGNGVLYGISPDGSLHWYRHLAPFTGAATWDPAGGALVGSGWGGFQGLIQEGAGVMYAVQADGSLRLYHHLDPYSGARTWATPGTSFGAGWTGRVTADPTACMTGDRNDVTFLQNGTHNTLMRYSWDDSQQSCLVSLWNRESNWVWSATNPSSGAYGIPQSLPASKMSTSGADYMDNPYTQIDWGLGYISDRYSTPCGAWSHEVTYGWY